MKIAVSCNGNQIWAHFGHCENFMIYEAENGVITSEQSVPNPGHRPGFLPNFLADMGVAVIISGGMGGGAVDIFNERGVEVVLGAHRAMPKRRWKATCAASCTPPVPSATSTHTNMSATSKRLVQSKPIARDREESCVIQLSSFFVGSFGFRCFLKTAVIE